MLGCILLMFVGSENFREVERLMRAPNPRAGKTIGTLGYDAARDLLRYEAAEENRFDVPVWEWTQILLGLALLLAVFVGTRGNKLAMLTCVAMSAAVWLQRLVLTPQLIDLGRSIDFTPLDSMTAQRDQYWMVHQSYLAVEAVKLLLGAGLGLRLFIFRAKRRGRLSSEIPEAAGGRERRW
ncbi:MAG: hypothetical protein ACRD9L_03495 [Bryobacteraceae bacterium]